jgi:hypothetical protein
MINASGSAIPVQSTLGRILKNGKDALASTNSNMRGGEDDHIASNITGIVYLDGVNDSITLEAYINSSSPKVEKEFTYLNAHLITGQSTGGGSGGGEVTDILPVLYSGVIDADGTVKEGTGFTCVKDSAGKYTVTFDKPVVRTSSISATCLNGSRNASYRLDGGDSEVSFWLKTLDTNAFTDSNFSFTVTGTETIAVGGGTGGGTTDILPVLLSGRIGSTGDVKSGTGFTTTFTAPNIYTVTFDKALPDINYSVISEVTSSASRTTTNKSRTENSVEILTWAGNTASAANIDFSIIGNKPISVGGGSGGDYTPEKMVYVDKKSERELDKWYTNDTGHLLYISLLTSNIANSEVQVFIDGLQKVSNMMKSNTGAQLGTTAIIPVGSTYMVKMTGAIQLWYEAELPLAVGDSIWTEEDGKAVYGGQVIAKTNSSVSPVIMASGKNDGNKIVALNLNNDSVDDNTETILRFGNTTAWNTTSGGGEISYKRNVGNQGSTASFKVQKEDGNLTEAMRINSSGFINAQGIYSNVSTGGVPNIHIGADGTLYKSTATMYSAEEVDTKLAVKDKLIEKLSDRLDKLEKKLKKTK